MACSICTHFQRADIENALLSMSSDNPEVTLEAIAEDYHVTLNELKVHALMHTQMGISPDAAQQAPSIARQLKLKEADILSAVINEYMVTLKAVGRSINALTYNENFEQRLNKPVVDLYLGTGGEIRSTVKTLAELNGILNGPETGGNAGLLALVQAITNSKGGAGTSSGREED